MKYFFIVPSSSMLNLLLTFLLFPCLVLSHKHETHSTFGQNMIIKKYSQLDLRGGAVGPESIAFNCRGEGPYVSVSDGRVLKWQKSNFTWTEFAITSPHRDRKMCDGSANKEREPKCGRPLGIKFNPSDCELYIADAYFGLLVVGPEGGLAKPLSTSADGIPFRFTNSLDVDSQTGAVYFTDSSILFQRRVWFTSILNGDKTGRLMTYDPRTKNVTVLLKGLAFPNGVALSKDNSFLLLAETGTFHILKLHLKGPKIHKTEIFAELQRFPDNIKRNGKGEFWVALNSGRLVETTSSTTDSVHHDIEVPWFAKDPVAVKYDEQGKVKSYLDGKQGKELESVSEVEEYGGGFWIGSAVKPYVGFIKV